MSFKYINPGYCNLLKSDAGAPSMQQNSDPEKSRTGISFQNPNMKNVLFYQSIQNNEVWFKCDVYIPFVGTRQQRIFIGEIAPDASTRYPNTGIFINLYSSTDASIHVFFYKNNSTILVTGYANQMGLKFFDINTIFLHWKYGEAGTGFIDIQINDQKYDRLNTYAIKPYDTSKSAFDVCGYIEDEGSYFSNIIFSDEEFSPKETVITLPISSNETDMTFDSDTGIYTATAVNQTLMSAVNTDYLANEYGSDSAVTGIALIGNPAYKTANGLTSLTAQLKENNVITDIETISLDDDTSAMILASQKISDKTIADLQNIQFGWKAGS